jgi:hypothetical protein
VTWRCIRAGVVAAFVLVAPATAAAATQVLLPPIRSSMTPGPPLGGTNTPTEVLFPPGMESDETVHVGVDATGKPVGVEVVQRLTLTKLGDYSFAVPGPIADVDRAPGSDSEPGLRQDAVLWSGFSSGKRTLAARATLRVAPAAPLLPLRLTLAREGDALVVRGENATEARGPVLVGPISAREAAKALAETRKGVPVGRAAPDLYVTVPRAPLSQSEPIVSALDVSGTVGARTFRYRLGDGGPMRFELRVPNASPRTKLRLTVTPVPPTRLLDRPTTRSLEEISRLRLMIARALQYQTFLANPNANGRSSARYVYETQARVAAPVPTQREDASDGNALRLVLVVILAVSAAGALVVLWAHS